MLYRGMLYLSVDGGATKTVAALYNEDEIFKVSIGGPSNFRNIGIGNFKRNIKTVVSKVIKDVDPEKIDLVTFALAGIKDSRESTELITSNIKGIFKFKRMDFFNDGEAAFYCRFPDGEGIILAPGTGMVSYGIWKGNKVRSSGWGWFLDDEGGAFFIGKRALQESVKVWDGRSGNDLYKESLLPNRLKDFYSIQEERGIINKVYKTKIDIREIASIAPIVSGLASKNDPLALDIMKEAAKESVTTIISTYNKFNRPVGIKISGYGGVFRSGRWYIDMIFNDVKNRIPSSEILDPFFGYEAVIGSIVMNLMNSGYTIDMEEINKFRVMLNSKINEIPAYERRKYLFMD